MNDRVALDSSALVAILNAEPEEARFETVIDCAPLVIGWPTILETRIWCLRHSTLERQRWLDDLIGDPRTLAVPFDEALEQRAHQAYASFGKGRHPAKLNFGDCMAYAVARQYDLPLLFKGGDFGQTDVRVHPASVLAPPG